MTSNLDKRPLLSPEDEQFVEHLAADFAPSPLTPAQRVAFDEALEARLERRRQRTALVPAFATVAVAAMVAWLTVPGFFKSISTNEPTGTKEPSALVAQAQTAAEWEYELFYPSELGDADDQDDIALLPDDYRAIASVLLDG